MTSSHRRRRLTTAAILFLGSAVAPGSMSPAAAQSMRLTSADVKADAAMPRDHVYPCCGGKNISPQLSWQGVPKGTKSLVLTLIDLEGTRDYWTHWVIADIPPTTTSLARATRSLPTGARAVMSNFGDLVYAGPCPPPGTGVHHYEITVWAMPTATVEVAPDANARALRTQLEKQSIEHASLNTVVASK